MGLMLVDDFLSLFQAGNCTFIRDARNCICGFGGSIKATLRLRLFLGGMCIICITMSIAITFSIICRIDFHSSIYAPFTQKSGFTYLELKAEISCLFKV